MRGVCSEFEGGNPSQMLLEMNQFGAVPGETPKPRNQMCDDEKESENENPSFL